MSVADESGREVSQSTYYPFGRVRKRQGERFAFGFYGNGIRRNDEVELCIGALFEYEIGSLDQSRSKV